jgi:16S rRNA G966 N2-methylase RsmD
LGIPTAAQVASRRTFAGTAEILRMAAMDALEQLANGGAHIDFVFADPPYANAQAYEDILAFLGESELLARGGRMIAEHRGKNDLPKIAGDLERTRVVEQGDSALSFYQPILAA